MDEGDEVEVGDKEGVTASRTNSWDNARSKGKENAVSDMNLCCRQSILYSYVISLQVYIYTFLST